LLYAGLMLTEDGARVLEFNCRFGDPETQAVLPRLDGDLLTLLASAAEGRLDAAEASATTDAAVTVVLAAKGYPEDPETGVEIRGLSEAEATGALVFHAGTALREGSLVSAGGRVLAVTATAAGVTDARDRAYEAVARIDFPGAQYRSDIAYAAAVHV
jgi:phosphoribosylamine---glycine ligase